MESECSLECSQQPPLENILSEKNLVHILTPMDRGQLIQYSD